MSFASQQKSQIAEYHQNKDMDKVLIGLCKYVMEILYVLIESYSIMDEACLEYIVQVLIRFIEP